MSDVRSPALPPRRSRAGLLVAVLFAGLITGLGAMWWAVRMHPGWFDAAAPVQTAATQPAAALDTGTLATRNTQLAAQLATLENRTATITSDSAVAAGNAGRAEAILVAFAARRAVERGVGLGYLEQQLRARFGRLAPDQTNAVIAAARRPVTLEDLRASLETAAPQLLAAGGHWWSGLSGELRNLVVIHPAGVASPRPADRLARALRLLDRGSVEAALAEVRLMPGAASATAWTDAAARYAATQRALDALETVAIVGVPDAGGGVAPAPAARAPAPSTAPAAAPAASPSPPAQTPNAAPPAG